MAKINAASGSRWRPVLLFFLLLSAGSGAFAAEPGGGVLQVPAAALWSESFDPQRATDAWIQTLSAEQRERSDAYYEGGYWLQLWDVVYGLAVAWLLLASRVSTSLRDRLEKWTRRRWLQSLLFGAAYVVAAWVLTLPLTVYSEYFREHQYGLANQSFGPWFGEQLTSLAVAIVLGGAFIAGLYAAIQRAGRSWWAWAGVVTSVFLVFVIIISPVFIAPLFNKYEALAPSLARDSLLSLARANGIPADNVYAFDASKQTTRISANVSGALGTTRISLNDNLLYRTSLPEIRAVMAHEMGHYALNHTWRLLIYLSLLFLIGFLFVHVSFDRFLRRWGIRVGVRGLGDVAGLPAVAAIFSVFMLLATPVRNTVVRTAEAEADIFGLNAAREPQGFASAAMRLSTYRKINPSALEEALLYDHPSGRTRVQMSMRWLAENRPTAQR